jgi:hypothetical protein
VTHVLCLRCRSTYDLGHVQTVARYADCTVYITPCCNRQVDDRKWVPSPAFLEIGTPEAARAKARPVPRRPTGATPATDDWRHRSACLDTDPALWFAADGERANGSRPRVAAAVAICATCPVTTQCLRDALDTRDHHGVRAGIDMATLPDRSRGKLRARLRALEAA